MSVYNYLDCNNTSLIFYSPFRFLREMEKDFLVKKTVVEPIINDIDQEKIQVVVIEKKNQRHFFLVKKLDWDSDYFGFDHYKILNVFYEHNDFNLLCEAIGYFIRKTCTQEGAYYFIDLPSEETRLIQAFNCCGFRLVESRLNYYYNNMKKARHYQRYPTRLAQSSDAMGLKIIASNVRNPFDRFHADCLLPDMLADEYIGDFAYNSVLGFADFVLIPDIPDEKPFGFLTAKKQALLDNVNVYKLVLAAIDNSVHNGWLFKLLSEMFYLLRQHDADALTVTTQTTNIAAFRTWGKFGFKLGYVTNILVYMF